jgi:toxin YoeB
MISFEDAGWDDYLHWQLTDKAVLKKINNLIRDIGRDPFGGIGKPEQLKQNLSGYCSRRITDEHRIVYLMDGDDIIIAQCRGHYD